MPNRTYPIERVGDDPRFALGLVFEVGEVLQRHGYPPVNKGSDLVELQQVLHGFLYSDAAPAPTPEPSMATRPRPAMDEHALIHALEEPTADPCSPASRYVSGAWAPEDDLREETTDG